MPAALSRESLDMVHVAPWAYARACESIRDLLIIKVMTRLMSAHTKILAFLASNKAIDTSSQVLGAA